MAYTRQLRTVIPVLADQHTDADDQTLVWLVRESFEREAAGEELVLTDWRDCGDMDPADVPPKTERDFLKRPATDFRWRMFEAVATRAVPGAGID
ncbi:hypothetical protein MINS_12570 [Mycolicibacterium insubricum]|uniref:Uncharacterized protein n=1 Tax=Mycolicibacterium insubricum TaxID=444597 RepID=A0A1X0D833_9MYCO|nr:hypothetical protein [Mycolicibacterium insubricum]MCV7080219.1 hypothetical protein [Mycolicibacterium insubricum]ORA68517.1 hypothetical protein BST26_14305 [Mycolicibacterium insubricum]BBZ65828.1 hypothetical protein MINS_12570 [Mycolicibacterium insubricum]